LLRPEKHMASWVKVREYATRFEAEMARARIESAHIPVALTSHEAGIFGPGFQGAVPSGVELLVPANRVRDVVAMLNEAEQGTAADPE